MLKLNPHHGGTKSRGPEGRPGHEGGLKNDSGSYAKLEETSLRLFTFLSDEDKVRKSLLDTKSLILDFPAWRAGKNTQMYKLSILELCYSHRNLICSCRHIQLSIKYYYNTKITK